MNTSAALTANENELYAFKLDGPTVIAGTDGGLISVLVPQTRRKLGGNHSLLLIQPTGEET